MECKNFGSSRSTISRGGIIHLHYSSGQGEVRRDLHNMFPAFRIQQSRKPSQEEMIPNPEQMVFKMIIQSLLHNEAAESCRIYNRPIHTYEKTDASSAVCSISVPDSRKSHQLWLYFQGVELHGTLLSTNQRQNTF